MSHPNLRTILYLACLVVACSAHPEVRDNSLSPIQAVVTHIPLAPTITFAPISSPTATPTITLSPVRVIQTKVVPTARPTPSRRLVFTPTPEPRIKVIVSSANIRSGPGTSFQVLEIALRGKTLTVMSRTRSGNWYNVKRTDGTMGWIAASVTTLVGTMLEKVPVAATIPTLPIPLEIVARPSSTQTILSPTISVSTPFPPPPTLPPVRNCCKYCDKGKACGDTCISRSKTCHTPPGCACNASLYDPGRAYVYLTSDGFLIDLFMSSVSQVCTDQRDTSVAFAGQALMP